MEDLHAVLVQFAARYRAAVLTKAGVLAALGMTVLGASAWRLRLLKVPSMWSLGAPMALAAAVAVGLGWWVRRHWLSPRVGAAYLDQLFGLQQRLVTAEEFADAAHPSSLYPLLVEDAARRCETAQAHLPKPLTSASGLLVLVLVLLLVWPHGGRTPMRLAQLPTPPSPPSPSQIPPPPTPQSEPSRQQQQNGGSAQQSAASSSAQSGASGSGQPQHQSGSTSSSSGSNQPQPLQTGGSSSQSTSQHGQGQGQDQSQGRQSSPPQGGGSQESAQQSPSRVPSGEQQEKAGGGNREANAQPHTNGAQGERQAAGARQGAQPSSGSNRSAQGRQPSGGGQQDRAGTSSASTTGQQQRAGLPAPPKNVGGAQAGAGSGQSAGDQEALKGEIQQLLKEVSGELKQLQAQLDAANSQAHPDAGTGTEAQLYEAPTPLGPSGHTPLAIQLQTDTGEVKTPRPGRGVGRASQTASNDAPQTPAEAAQLSEAPLEESSSVRQTVPPDYVGVFDRLHRPRTPPASSAEATQ